MNIEKVYPSKQWVTPTRLLAVCNEVNTVQTYSSVSYLYLS